ncbi:PLP-dependent aminotransferase family protein [Kitasatospora cheerisanensis]|uniref:GntR family transcriptional regulator n=1 Tax=Kitasatospora cheerisanensis KCTC 2395 TaxID=1348663 RepID=A0A066YVH4_9ACTN|nr:PLP-dependent aminotransferase family protein [Kitasatospora cheerisanensis]KDN81940.1 GntR family transcriptional regulator [Kitasatospora cheerisanensis KCTC 2395]
MTVQELTDALRSTVLRYSPGERVPSSRELVERYRVSPVSVSRAIRELVAEGVVVTRPGAGVFRAEPRPASVAQGDFSWQEVALSAEAGAPPARTVDASGVLAALALAPPEVIDLNSGYPHPSLLPERALAGALSRAARRPGAWGRPPLEGLPELRGWFAREIGGGVTAAEVLITAGGQSALTTALRSLAPPGAPVLVESPTYPGLLAIARAAGLRPVPVPADQDGVRPERLAEAFAATGARLFVCQPLFQNPTGAVLGAERRRAVLAAAKRAGAFVVEDDFARLLAHADAPELPPPLAADDPDGTVVHLRSLTKAAAPSLRVGALVARGPALARLRAVQAVDSFFVPRPLQEAALELVTSPDWPRHLRTLARELTDRRQLFAAALAHRAPELLPDRLPYGGFHLWLPLPGTVDPGAFTSAALRHGVAVSPGRGYFTAEPAPRTRTTFAAAETHAQLTDAAHRLATALASLA